MTVRDEMRIDPAAETERIVAFIRSELEGAGVSNVVLGLSGGLDSATVAYLCARAAGAGNVFTFLMPYRTSSPASIEHAWLVVQELGLTAERIEVTPAVDALQGMLSGADQRRLGNVMARVRMIVLYDQSARHRALVAGTSNRTERLLGYTTLYGDSACGFAPIGHLYKCQVLQLAEHIGVPDDVIAKPPSADLWEGQTDEGELGFSYDDVDWLLFNLNERDKDADALTAMGFDPNFVDQVQALVARTEFKRRMPNTP